MLSSINRSEFLACPQLIRFDYARGQNGFEPTLLIKCNTLLLKYIVLGAPMQLAFAKCGGRLLYVLQICDDGDRGCILWSVVERDEELNGIRGIAHGQALVGFIFNELSVNVAWNDLVTAAISDHLSELIDSASIGQIDHSEIKLEAQTLLDKFHHEDECAAWLKIKITGKSEWHFIDNHFITADASSSLINLIDNDEGKHQEKLGIWLTDNLQPAGVYYSPQILKVPRTRELTDILLSHEFGATLIESKSISIFSRQNLPDRKKLGRDVSTHIGKAFTQLRGAIRTLKSGISVASPQGNVLSINREKPAHAIVLIPDLALIEHHDTYGIQFMQDFMEATGGFPHLLDISELLRVVQAAEMISARGNTITPMMAFDYYLMQRIQKAIASETLCIEVLLRFADNEAT